MTRRANKGERERAQELVDDFFAMEGIASLKSRAERLAEALQHFAISGTFRGGGGDYIAAQKAVKRCRSQRATDRMRAIVDELGCSERTAWRMLKKIDNPEVAERLLWRVMILKECSAEKARQILEKR